MICLVWDQGRMSRGQHRPSIFWDHVATKDYFGVYLASTWLSYKHYVNYDCPFRTLVHLIKHTLNCATIRFSVPSARINARSEYLSETLRLEMVVSHGQLPFMQHAVSWRECWASRTSSLSRFSTEKMFFRTLLLRQPFYLIFKDNKISYLIHWGLFGRKGLRG